MGVAAAVDGVEWWACHAPAAKWKDEAACGCSACGRLRLWLVLSRASQSLYAVSFLRYALLTIALHSEKEY